MHFQHYFTCKLTNINYKKAKINFCYLLYIPDLYISINQNPKSNKSLLIDNLLNEFDDIIKEYDIHCKNKLTQNTTTGYLLKLPQK